MLSTVPGTADVLNGSPPKKPQTLLCCFCRYVWDLRGLAPPTSGGPGASDEYMLDLDNNPTRMCRLHSLLLQMGKVCSGNTETLPKASALQTTSPGLLHSIPGSLTGPSLPEPPSFSPTGYQAILPLVLHRDCECLNVGKRQREWHRPKREGSGREQRGKHLVLGAGGGASQELEMFHGLGGH